MPENPANPNALLAALIQNLVSTRAAVSRESAVRIWFFQTSSLRGSWETKLKTREKDVFRRRVSVCS